MYYYLLEVSFISLALVSSILCRTSEIGQFTCVYFGCTDFHCCKEILSLPSFFCPTCHLEYGNTYKYQNNCSGIRTHNLSCWMLVRMLSFRSEFRYRCLKATWKTYTRSLLRGQTDRPSYYRKVHRSEDICVMGAIFVCREEIADFMWPANHCVVATTPASCSGGQCSWFR
jgi:hypothetical protein